MIDFQKPTRNLDNHHTLILKRVQLAFLTLFLYLMMTLEKNLKSSASKSCPVDPMPTTILKDCLDVILPVITNIVNLSLSTSVMPGKLKEALLAPSIKKAILDTEILKNFRPISILVFTSKIVKKVVDSQLESYITDNNLYDPLQSAYKEFHSTETALVKVTNDILCVVDNFWMYQLHLIQLTTKFFLTLLSMNVE